MRDCSVFLVLDKIDIFGLCYSYEMGRLFFELFDFGLLDGIFRQHKLELFN